MNRSFLKITILIICTIGMYNLGYSQLSKTHYIPPLTYAAQGNAYPENQYVYISTPSLKDISFTIKQIGQPGNDITGIVSNSSSQEVYLGNDQGQLFVDSNATSTVMQKGYIIEAEDVIYVSVRMEAGGAQAGALVSKGLTALGTTFRAGMYTNENPQDNYLNFISVMATEDNTTVTFDGLQDNLVIKNYSGSFPVITPILDAGESYVLATNSFEHTLNRAGLIGTLVTSDKPVVVNCGSANGSFHNGTGRDYGIDQIVDVSKIGDEYIFVKGGGQDGWENVLIVAHEDNTEILIDSVSATPPIFINAGEYYLIEGNEYSSNGNLYVKTTKEVFVYQGVGANGSGEANQGMFFVPPLSCETRGNVNKIAMIDRIGGENYPGGITIVTKKGAVVTINNQDIASQNPQGPFDVIGKSEYVTYKVDNLNGDISVECDQELYCAYFNQNGAATSGSFYSGFPSAPEINFEATFQTLGICIPNITLSATNVENFDSYEWYFDDGSGLAPTGISTPDLVPDKPGRYMLEGIINCTGLVLKSVEVPVSICPDDSDYDGIIDNLDIDNDNDGILNCEESAGNATIDLSSFTAPVLKFKDGTSSNSMIDGIFSENNSSGASNSFIGYADGSFESTVNTGNDVENHYRLDFNQSLDVEFLEGTGTSETTMDSYVIVRVYPAGKNITLIDPDGQLLIDTNFDGVFESGIDKMSGSEIHFKINPTPSGITPYRFTASKVEGISVIHKLSNLVTTNSFSGKIGITCFDRDTDGDGIADSFDYDSDNDGIPDIYEAFGNNYTPLSTTDDNKDGLDDVFNSLTGPIDTDFDGVFDYIDLDSDNDGIYDLEESGSSLSDSDFDGVVDNALTNIGLNGLVDAAESSPDSGIIGYSLADLDMDNSFNYIDLDSDGDLCNDVIEAGFSDDDLDGYLSSAPISIDQQGRVTNGSDGYGITHPNYLLKALIQINTPPENTEVCIFSDTFLTIDTNAEVYNWQYSSDGTNWSDITDLTHYSGIDKDTLHIINTPISFDKLQYRTKLDISGNSCGIYANPVVLNVNPLPVITPVVRLTQCDVDTDGISIVNLTEANDKISTNASNETFIYYNTLTDAELDVNPISDPTLYTNKAPNYDEVWARVISTHGCFDISKIEVIVSATYIPLSFQHNFYNCDDYLDPLNDDRDGVSSFDMSHIPQEVIAIFPPGSPLKINLYRNENDALSETNPIIDLANYRNIGYPGTQDIYIRVDSEINNDCLGFGHYITLNVEELPVANEVIVPRQCDDDQDGFFPFDVSSLESELLQGQTGVSVSYFDAQNNPLPSPLPNPFYSASQQIRIRVTNNVSNDPDGACFDETTVDFIVDTLPQAHPVQALVQCDTDYDGNYDFDTSNIENTILNGQTGMEVYYYDDQGNALTSPLPNPFTTSSQFITVEVINPINTTCKATTIIDFTVNPRPKFDIIAQQILCLTEPPTPLLLEVYIDGDSNEVFEYSWQNEFGNMISDQPTVEVSQPGIYNVTLTKSDGTGCSHTESIEIIPSEFAKITLNDFEIIDDSDNNIIRIDDSNLGTGEYEFSLDNDFTFQDEPEFQYVEPGIHTVFINDKNGCGMTSIDVSVIGYPKFFSPNNDGHNDTWKIFGVNEIFYPNAKIYIFDRFGKIIAEIRPDSEGWDGSVNNQILPSTDYWFYAELIDLNGKTRIKKGHFSMIR